MSSTKTPSRNSPTDDHRRKQNHHTHLLNDQSSQKTIYELFPTSKQRVENREPDDVSGSSPSKRLKRSHLANSEKDRALGVKTTRASDMYNFSASPRMDSPEIIDLTASPNGSPVKKKTPNGIVRPSNFTSTGPKKLVIKNLKKASGPDLEQYYDGVWMKLDAALTAIFQDEEVPYSKETLYNEVMTLCRQNRAPSLYQRLCEKCTKDVTSRVRAPLLRIAGPTSHVEFLYAVIEAWTRWSKQLETIRSIFFFLDRSFLLHSGLPSIIEMGVHEFYTYIFCNNDFQPKVLQGACDLVRSERTAPRNPCDERLLREAVEMFHILPVYGSCFEPKLLADSQKFYSSWAEQTVASTDLAAYVEMCDKIMNEETRHCEAWGLDATTKKELGRYLEEILIEEREKRLLSVDEIGQLLSQDRTESLHRLYLLLERRRFEEKLRPAFEAYIVKQGSEIVFDEAREQDMVLRLLNFKRKLDQIWEHSFKKHIGIGHTLREAFENFINKSKRSNMTWGTDNPKPGEMIAKYVDIVLKGGAKAIRASGVDTEDVVKATEQDGEASSEDEDTEITKQLDQVLDLFRFVHGKAVFEAFYKRDLARRLLLGRSASSDAEKSMLTRLKSGESFIFALAYLALTTKP